MNYILILLIGVIVGLTVSIFVTTYFSKKNGLIAIKEDLTEIKDQIKNQIMP
jgi:hypothetical protein